MNAIDDARELEMTVVVFMGSERSARNDRRKCAECQGQAVLLQVDPIAVVPQGELRLERKTILVRFPIQI